MTVKKIVLIIFLITSFYFKIIGSEENDSIGQVPLTTIAQAHQGNSYATILEGIGQIEHLWFEASLVPSFYIRVSEDSRLLGVLTPQVILRMYQEQSFPVRTPSYMPQTTVYWSIYNQDNYKSLNLFGRLAHHSNGQQDDFYRDNGEINLKSGNFSTNYFELGLIKTDLNTKFNAVRMLRTSIEIHPPVLSADELDGRYSFYRWNNLLYIFKLNKTDKLNKSQKANISLKAELNWLFGKMDERNFLDIDRLTFSGTFTYHPNFLEDIVLFIQYYHGMDYYNIYFSNTVHVIRMGIMTEVIRF